MATRTSGSTGPGAFEVAQQGLPMAHGDVRMSDLVRLPPPSGPPSELWHDSLPAGSGGGLGAVGNGTVAACTYVGDTGDNLVVYDGAGTRLWTSGALLDGTAFASVPLLDEGGGVLAADDRTLVRFAPDGSVLWRSETPGGLPISPVITVSGVVVLATKGGPVSVFDSRDGTLLGSLQLPAPSGAPWFFDTVNTPCVRADRVYIAAQETDGTTESPDHVGALVAVDVDRAAEECLSVAWQFLFGSPSGGSPLRLGDTVYFDGDRARPGKGPSHPQLFAVRDGGDAPEPLWLHPMSYRVLASAAEDPRGGLWTYAGGDSQLLRLDAATGQQLQDVDVTALFGGEDVHVPATSMSIAGSRGRPVMLVGVTTLPVETVSWLAAIDLLDGVLLWSWQLTDPVGADRIAGQFPVVLDSGGHPRVVFTTHLSGAYALGTP